MSLLKLLQILDILDDPDHFRQGVSTRQIHKLSMWMNRVSTLIV